MHRMPFASLFPAVQQQVPHFRGELVGMASWPVHTTGGALAWWHSLAGSGLCLMQSGWVLAPSHRAAWPAVGQHSRPSPSRGAWHPATRHPECSQPCSLENAPVWLDQSVRSQRPLYLCWPRKALTPDMHRLRFPPSPCPAAAGATLHR